MNNEKNRRFGTYREKMSIPKKVIIGRDDDQLLAAIYANSQYGKSSIDLILYGDKGFSIAPKSKLVGRCKNRYDEYAALMTLLSDYGNDTEVILASKEAYDLYLSSRAFFKGYGIEYNDNNKMKIAEKSVSRYRKISLVLEKIGVEKAMVLLKKVYHKDVGQYLVCGSADKITEKHCEYSFKEITASNCEELYDDRSFTREIKTMLSTDNIKGVALLDRSIVIGEAFIKKCGAKDRIFSIKSRNSYVISLMNIRKQYRGRHLQQVLISKLVDSYTDNKENAMLYAYIYYYNRPSLKNFIHMGFRPYKKINARRLMRHTINKERI